MDELPGLKVQLTNEWVAPGDVQIGKEDQKEESTKMYPVAEPNGKCATLHAGKKTTTTKGEVNATACVL
jgi:hypothetical protein